MFRRSARSDNANNIQNRKHLNGMLPAYSWLLLALSLIWNCAAYYAGRLASHNAFHHIFALALDEKIPVLPWTTVLYVLFFPFWIFNYALVTKREKAFVMRFFCADFLSRVICLIFYILLPTTLVRPEIPEGAFLGWMLRIVYFFDEPDNLFPSIHCLVSVMAAFGIHGESSVPKPYRIASCFIAAAICISTLTTKQHLVWDLISGIALAVTVWLISGSNKITGAYTRLVDGIYSLFRHNETV